MTEFVTYSPEEIINSNLLSTASRFDAVCEQELSHLSELAHEIAQTLEDGAPFSEILPDHTPLALTNAPLSVLDQNLPAVRSARELHSTWQKAWLCMDLYRRLAKKRPFSASLFFSDTETPSSNAYNRIAYQRSSYADSAYLKFAKLLPLPRLSYAHSFVSACEDVYNGLCEFCILPLENTTEGVLSTFFRLIEQYDLKIAATCDISSTDAGRTSRFALLRRSLTPTLDPQQESLYYSFCIPQRSEPGLSELMLVAKLYGIEVTRVDSFFAHREEIGPSIRLTLPTACVCTPFCSIFRWSFRTPTPSVCISICRTAIGNNAIQNQNIKTKGYRICLALLTKPRAYAHAPLTWKLRTASSRASNTTEDAPETPRVSRRLCAA